MQSRPGARCRQVEAPLVGYQPLVSEGLSKRDRPAGVVGGEPAAPVPQTALMPGHEFSTDKALATLRLAGPGRLLRDAFIRFRYGDGFSHARALALQTCLSLIPLAIALIGLASALGHEAVGARRRPHRAAVDPRAARCPGRCRPADTAALPGPVRARGAVAGPRVALISLTTAMAQVERGANRIYGIQRDRPAISKYARGFVLALAAGLPALLGFLLLVGGGAVGEALAATYHWGGDLRTWWNVLRWPTGLLLTWASYTILLAHAPNRGQPTRPWLAAGGLIAIVLWTAVTLLRPCMPAGPARSGPRTDR